MVLKVILPPGGVTLFFRSYAKNLVGREVSPEQFLKVFAIVILEADPDGNIIYRQTPELAHESCFLKPHCILFGDHDGL